MQIYWWNKMLYKDKINLLVSQISVDVVDFGIERKRGTAPTQAFSDFITHSEQGDWAESVFFDAIVTSIPSVKPIKYGKSDKIIAGDIGFKDFYNKYQDELDMIGKRPDILLFNSSQNIDVHDISNYDAEMHNVIVPKAIAGFEVRSSAYLANKFIPKNDRPFLSFTPKVEDLIVVLKWINKYNVPHYYVQVFFDTVYILSFEKILELLTTKEIKIKNKEVIGYQCGDLSFKIEKNPKNQYKATIHIFLNNGVLLSDKVELPTLVGKRKELASGRLLHYVNFNGGEIILNKKTFLNLIRDI